MAHSAIHTSQLEVFPQKQHSRRGSFFHPISSSWSNARSQHTRSHPWQGDEEKTWQARQIRTSGISKSCPGAHLKDALCLSDACYIRLLHNFCDSLPQSLSKQNQLRTLINMSPGWWYPIRLSRMKGVFQFRPLSWNSSLLGKCILMHMTARNTLIINSIKNLITQKALIGIEPFGVGGQGEEALLLNTKILF